MNNSSKLLKVKPRKSIDEFYQSLDDVSDSMYELMQPYNMFEITRELSGKFKEDLCIGRVGYSWSEPHINRDFFTSYPSLVTGIENPHKIAIEAFEIISDTQGKVHRTDGTILINCLLDEEMAKHENTIKESPRSIMGYTINDFIDVSLSRKVNGEIYYVLDMYRLKNHKRSVIKLIRALLEINKHQNMTKTLYVKFKGDKDDINTPREIGLWDIVNSCPIDGFDSK